MSTTKFDTDQLTPSPTYEQLLFHMTELGQPCATHQATPFFIRRLTPSTTQALPISHPAIRDHAVREFSATHHQAPPPSALKHAFRCLKAHGENHLADIHPRFHFDPATSTLHLDAARPDGLHLQISPDGWTLAPNAILTVIPPTAAPLADPAPPTNPEATLQSFRQIFNLSNTQTQTLVDWTLNALKPASRHPILHITGPAASGKSTLALFLRSLIDPSHAPINLTPTSESHASRLVRDNQLILLDGLTRIPRKPAELLSRISTGIPLNFHGDQRLAARPVLLTTSLDCQIDRLRHRTTTLELPPLDDPRNIDAELDALRPELLAAIYTLAAQQLATDPQHWPEPLPTPPTPTFIESLDSFLRTRPHGWRGTAADLGKLLNSSLSPKAISQLINQSIASGETQIHVTHSRQHGGIRILTVARTLMSAASRLISTPAPPLPNVPQAHQAVQPCPWLLE